MSTRNLGTHWAQPRFRGHPEGQAEAYLAETGMAPGRYRQVLAERGGELLAQGRAGRYPVSLTASWQPVPFTLFTAHPDRLPARLAGVAGDPVGFTELIGVLGRRALARVAAESLQVHRLVQAVLRTVWVRTAGEVRYRGSGAGAAARGSAHRSVEQPGGLTGVAHAAVARARRHRPPRRAEPAQQSRPGLAWG
ncbi:MAG: hypothetical protein ACRDTF_18575 [Pseudonocardiaceae bacterium]